MVIGAKMFKQTKVFLETDIGNVDIMVVGPWAR